ncbi:hypothetical protein F5X68DRAFT_160383 [Plectosphaerella plurivora]|uniref:Zn(2)-C6 fungal-type domain-containing protein n=1 Tax=Plectosphaerella plurivora TaxID=936078 RepID=A0A9P9A6S0_9PEZI|nr:hypothetical protein F5X68DRAFT_160383 [Plectosphaerella plurivora]
MQPGRGVLSCGSCRQRKLKCDRNEPCSNCVTRQVDCTYPFPSANRTRGTAHSALRRDAGVGSVSAGGGVHQARNLDGRLRHLEELISNIVAQRASPQTSEAGPSNTSGPVSEAGPATQQPQIPPPVAIGLDESAAAAEEVKPGSFISHSDQVTFVSGVHWAAICEEISKIKEDIDEESWKASGYIAASPTSKGPMLLEGMFAMPDLWEVLQDIPPRNISDRLVSRAFASKEPMTVIIHGPTFQKDYTKFWQDPSAVPLPWLSVLFGVLTVGCFLYMRSGENLPGTLGTLHTPDVIEVFHQRGTQSLMMSRYTVAPTMYTIEALGFNIQQEFMRQRDAHMGLGVLAGIVVRLAMRMGMHRDPEKYSQITPFVGEMRRRVWASVLQLDALASTLLGMPAMIHESQYDTKLPRNLQDEDFHEDIEELPPSRPETELTPVLYSITKTRLLTVFRAIFNRVCLGHIESYDQVMAYDRRLRSVHSQMSPRFRVVNIEDAITDPPFLIIRRFNVDILFQKARCMLHRHHMTRAYADSRFNFSRTSGVEGAMEILRHQASIHQEVQPGGVLHNDRWFVTTLERNDFLLASMIVCVELNSRGRDADVTPQDPSRPEDGYKRYSRADLVAALQRSRFFWAEYRTGSAEAQQAFNLLSVMLDKVSTGGDAEQSQQQQQQQQYQEAGFSEQYGGNAGLGPEAMATNQTFEGIGMLLDTPDTLDWGTWEAFLQGPQGPL